MKTPNTETPILAWYRVPELWLILILLGATVIGSFALLATAIRSPDRHIVAPNEEPRSSRIPPIHPAPSPPTAAPAEPGKTP